MRKVERYGVFSYEEIVERLSLPSADGKVSSIDTAAEFIAKYAEFKAHEVLLNRQMMTQPYRKACLILHPDQPTGNKDVFIKLNEAKEVLDKHFG